MKKLLIVCLLVHSFPITPEDSFVSKIKLTSALSKLSLAATNLLVITGLALKPNYSDENLKLKKELQLLKSEEAFIDCLVNNLKKPIYNNIPMECADCHDGLIMAGGSQKANLLIEQFRESLKIINDKQAAQDKRILTDKVLIVSGCVLVVSAATALVIFVPGIAPAIIAGAKASTDFVNEVTQQCVNDFKNLPTTEKIIQVAKVADSINADSKKIIDEADYVSNDRCELAKLKRKASMNGSLSERVQKKYA